jgi:hypothetical protein
LDCATSYQGRGGAASLAALRCCDTGTALASVAGGAGRIAARADPQRLGAARAAASAPRLPGADGARGPGRAAGRFGSDAPRGAGARRWLPGAWLTGPAGFGCPAGLAGPTVPTGAAGGAPASARARLRLLLTGRRRTTRRTRSNNCSAMSRHSLDRVKSPGYA